jgi:hypothetical protein
LKSVETVENFVESRIFELEKGLVERRFPHPIVENSLFSAKL